MSCNCTWTAYTLLKRPLSVSQWCRLTLGEDPVSGRGPFAWAGRQGQRTLRNRVRLPGASGVCSADTWWARQGDGVGYCFTQEDDVDVLRLGEREQVLAHKSSLYFQLLPPIFYIWKEKKMFCNNHLVRISSMERSLI